MPPHLIAFQQAVYGSFPFWDRGYGLLAHSPGLRESWLDGFRLACQRYGEPSGGATASRAFFALRLPRGPYLIVGVEPQGTDDRGRPGALAFHGLFVHPEYMKKLRYNPFALAEALEGRWSPETKFHHSYPWPIPDAARPISEKSWISRALIDGKRVALESSTPIDELARSAWSHLPMKVRRRASVATMAFGNDNRFDLVALPRLAGVSLDETYLLTPPTPRASKPKRLKIALIGLSIAIIAALGLIFTRDGGTRTTETPVVEAPPAMSLFGNSDDPGERARVVEGLVDLADRFGVLDGPALDDPTALMNRISDRLRYRGPRLSGRELAALRAEAGVAGEKAIALDSHINHFLADRPLPRDFDKGPLRWQLASLAWSYRVEVAPGRPAADVPFAIAEALAVPSSIQPGPIAEKYPVLADYERFLARLPKR